MKASATRCQRGFWARWDKKTWIILVLRYNNLASLGLGAKLFRVLQPRCCLFVTRKGSDNFIQAATEQIAAMAPSTKVVWTLCFAPRTSVPCSVYRCQSVSVVRPGRTRSSQTRSAVHTTSSASLSERSGRQLSGCPARMDSGSDVTSPRATTAPRSSTATSCCLRTHPPC